MVTKKSYITKICVNIMARPEENIEKYAGQRSVLDIWKE
jgi:hypothetical protein